MNLNLLLVKMAEAELDSPFTPGTAFAAIIDRESTDDDSIDAACFAEGGKVAIQAWFRSYNLTDRAGKASVGPNSAC